MLRLLSNYKSAVSNFDEKFFYTFNKRPLDSYACPDQSKINRTNQQTFLHAKNVQTWCNFMGKCSVCVKSLTFLAQKALFFNSIFRGQEVRL